MHGGIKEEIALLCPNYLWLSMGICGYAHTALHKKWSFTLQISLVNVKNSAGNVRNFSKEILHEKLFSLFSAGYKYSPLVTYIII